jgi:hypothetical protein
LVEGWPVQFLPAASELEQKSLAETIEKPIDADGSVYAKFLSAEHVVAAAFSLGRLKDLARIEMFLDQAELDRARLASMVRAYGLVEKWREFCNISGRAVPLGVL